MVLDRKGLKEVEEQKQSRNHIVPRKSNFFDRKIKDNPAGEY